ncbi:MAG: M42 family metallopeptidase [Promethearchaeota archaeon]
MVDEKLDVTPVKEEKPEPKEKTPTWDLELMRGLSETRGCSGHEEKISKYIRDKITPLCDKVFSDTMGNLYGVLHGANHGKPEDTSVMLSAHMDEIGFIVRYIGKEGFIRVSQIGGQNPRLLPGTRILICGSSGDEIPGVFGEKAIHFLKPEERKKTSDLKELFIDTGLNSKEEVEKYISIGDFAEFDQKLQVFPNTTRVNGKSLDDRAGCYVLIRALQNIKKLPNKPKQTIVFTFSTQEEVGVRGATVAGYRINPTLALALEVSFAFDHPNLKKSDFADVKMGDGPTISVGPNLHPKISKKLIDVGIEHKIPFQVTSANRPTGTDARIIQVTREGIPVGLVATPLRYMHTLIETIDLVDLESTADLVTQFLLSDLAGNYNL